MLMQLFDLTLAHAAELFAIPKTRTPVRGVNPRPEELLDGVIGAPECVTATTRQSGT